MSKLQQILDNLLERFRDFFAGSINTDVQPRDTWRPQKIGVRKRILIIEDEVDLCMLMKQYFVRLNYEVYIAHTCRDALNRASQIDPDIILVEPSSFRNNSSCLRKIQEAVPNARICDYSAMRRNP